MFYLRISLSCLSSPLRQSPSFTSCIFCSLSWPTSESSCAILSSFLILEKNVYNCHVWFKRLELGNKLMNDFLEPQKVFPTKNRWKSFQCWSYNLILSKLQLIPTWLWLQPHHLPVLLPIICMIQHLIASYRSEGSNQTKTVNIGGLLWSL